MRWEFREEHHNPGQWKLLNSQQWAVLLAGGFGSGKTTGLLRKMMQLAVINGKAPGILAAQSYRALHSVVMRNLQEQLRAALGYRRAAPYLKIHDKMGEAYLEWNGTPIFLRSATHAAGMDGLNVGWLCGDELRHWPEETFTVAQSRPRLKCPLSQRAYASTPSMGWMSQAFNEGKDGFELITAPTYENARNLAPDYIEKLRIQYSARLAKAVIDGWFVPLEGAVFDVLDPDVWRSEHVMDYEPNTLEARRRKTYLAVDPGFRRSAWLWIHQLAPTEWVVFDEMMPEDTSDMRCVEMVNARGWDIDEVWIDPAADATQSAFGIDTLTVLQALRSRTPDPIRTIPHAGPWRSIPFGIERLRALLDWGGNGKQYPRLRFAKRLEAIERSMKRGIVKDMQALVYPDPTPGIARRLDFPVKDGMTDHSVDSAKYWAVGMYMTVPELRADREAVQRLVAA